MEHTLDERMVADHIKRIEKLEGTTDKHTEQIGKLIGSAGTAFMLIKWVITPLLVIVASLVGIKLLLP